MGIFSAMQAGVSALNAYSSAMSTLSDNIANLNTTAYKQSGTDFTAIVDAQNTQTTYNAGGVLASTQQYVSQQGGMNSSTTPTNLAINGAGFFIVSPTTSAATTTAGALFTRDGSFSTNANGLLQNAQGYYLMGAPIAAGSTPTTAPTSLSALQLINLSNIGSTAVASTSVAISGNIDATTTAYTGPPAYAVGAMAGYPATAGSIAPQATQSVQIFDSLGVSRTLTLGYLKTGANTWAVEAYVQPSSGVTGLNGLVASGNVSFSTSGAPTAVSAGLQNFTINYTAASGAAAQPLSLNLTSGLTQYAGASALTSSTADGSPPGSMTGVTINSSGILTAQFSNGRSQALYQIPVATFLDPNGLQASTGGGYAQTLASGQFSISQAGAGSAGTVQSGTLEASNVDLGTQFTDLITTQRAYSAASRIITTADQMLQELLQIKPN